MNIKSGKLTTERRNFLRKLGGFTAMSTLGLSFFTSCEEEEVSPDNPDEQDEGDSSGITVNGNTITVELAKQSDLATDGGWLLIIDAQLLVVNDNGYVALTSRCTHSNCDRNWTYGNRIFECTCHGSQFNTSGEVVRGPANRDLQSFSTSVADNVLTIQK